MGATALKRHVDPDELVQQFESAMRARNDETPELEYDPEPEHLFAPGVYMRVLEMKAGAAIVSKIHKTEHFCIALTGRALVRVGDELEEIVAPRIMRTMPGTQRSLVILESAVWLTIHPTDETDVAAIEQQIIARTHNDPVLVALRQLSEG